MAGEGKMIYWTDAITSASKKEEEAKFYAGVQALRKKTEDGEAFSRELLAQRWEEEHPLNLPFLYRGYAPNRPAHLLQDVLAVGAGFIFALAEEQEKFQAACRNYWREVLDYVLTGKEPGDFTRGILAVVTGEEVFPLPQELKTAEVLLVKGGPVTIKRYFLENHKLPDIRGASYLLDKIASKEIPDFLRERYSVFCQVYTGGGNTLLVLPPAAAGVAAELEDIYRRHAPGSRAYFVEKKYTLEALVGKYSQVAGELERLKTERQFSDVPRAAEPEEAEVVKKGEFKTLANPAVCRRCDYRDARYLVRTAAGEEPMCLTCLAKYKAGSEAKGRLKGEYEQFLRQKSYLTGEKELEQCKDLQQLAVDDRIAVLYGDGNNMGEVVKNFRSFTAIRYFARYTDRATKEAVFAALVATMPKDHLHKVEFLSLGGDDLFLILPAKYALTAARLMGENFEKSYRGREGKPVLTLSVGVVIAKYNMPVRELFELAQESLKIAKLRSRELGGIGTVDVEVLESFTYFEQGLKAFREKTFGGADYYLMRPYSFAVLSGLENLIRFFKKREELGKNQIYRFRDSALSMDPEEFKWFYLYQVARHFLKNDRTKQVYAEFRGKVEEIAGALGGCFQEEDPFITAGDRKYLFWADIVQLWDYVGGGGE
ncbi:MAG: hypothetical protein PWQ31_1307 [Eubacteriales bacterium]|nr:hypothetical protein [Eubacteriales bacterium]